MGWGVGTSALLNILNTETNVQHVLVVCDMPLVRKRGGECILRLADPEYDTSILVTKVGTCKKMHFSQQNVIFFW